MSGYVKLLATQRNIPEGKNPLTLSLEPLHIRRSKSSVMFAMLINKYLWMP
jgi:hypothetical protein